MKKILTTLLCVVTAQLAAAQLNLEVTVHCDEAGTLFVKVQEQIEEVGELTDITELTVTGLLNRDDFNVIRNQMTNLTDLDLSGVDGECGSYVDMSGHKALQRCVTPTEATSLRGSCFSGCTSLVSITLPEKLQATPNYGWENCSALAEVTIPDSVTFIGYQSFKNTALTEITIPARVTQIDGAAFRDCTKLATINILSDSLTLKNNVFCNTGLVTYTLPKGVVIDGDATFADCKNLKSLYFPDGLTTEKQVGTGTFSGCTALEEVRLPQDLTILPGGFFVRTRIKAIDLPTTVTHIGQYAYEGITTMPKAVIPNHVTKVDQFVFYENHLEEVVWSEGCHIIPNDAFRACKWLTKVTIPETVDSIQENAFYYCTALDSIHLPEGIRTLRGTFNQCQNLRVVNIPSTVTVIDRGVEGCFNKCIFTHIDIPDGVHTIGWGSFSSVPLEDLKLPSKLRKIGGYAFSGGKYKRVTVPEGVIWIGERAFYSDSLRCLDLPSTLITLGGITLGDNSRHHPDSVIIRTVMPPFSNNNFFGSGDLYKRDDLANTVLYVPEAGLSLYKADSHYNKADSIAVLKDVHASVLNVLNRLIITPETTLGTDKYDVNVIDSWGQSNLYEVTSNDHPYVRIEDGSTFRIGKLSMTFETSAQYWFTDYKWQTFANFAVADVDIIDLNWIMGAEHFFTPAFDTRLSDIVPEYPNTPYAFYRYDSGARAAGNFAGTWVRMGSDETLRAGQGYAFKSAETGIRDASGTVTKKWTGLHHIWKAEDGATSYFVTSDNITLPLNHYNGEFPHNRNWNYIGNPYPAFLDIRGVDYDGPMYIFNSDSWDRQWYAVSALDDEYVIDPMDAIFVQVPEGVNDITFLAARRQHSKKFVKGEEGSGTRTMRRAAKNRTRTVYNFSIVPTETTSPAATTRLVINPTATTSYEIGRDLPVMNMSSEGEKAAQLYTLCGGVAYAINERPVGDGVIPLGIDLPKDGTYALSFSLKKRADAASTSEDLYLIDNDENTRTLISDGEPYTFTANAGSSTSRFVLAFGEANPTSVDNEEWSMVNGQWSSSLTYDLQGRPVSKLTGGVYIQNGRKVVIK